MQDPWEETVLGRQAGSANNVSSISTSHQTGNLCLHTENGSHGPLDTGRTAVSSDRITSSSRSPHGSPRSDTVSNSSYSIPVASWKLSNNRACEVMQNSKTDSKLKRIFGAHTHLYRWADMHGHYNDPLLPPSEAVLIMYISDTMAEKVSEQTARRHMSLLKEHCEDAGLGWKGGNELEQALVGSMVKPSSFRPQQEPVMEDMLDAIFQDLDLEDESGKGSDPLNTCVFAALTSVFYGQARLDEILTESSNPDAYNHCRHPVSMDLTLNQDGCSYNLFLPSTKTEIYRGNSILIPGQLGKPCDPVAALYFHAVTNDEEVYFDPH
ncbi:hypothetical protein AAF712_010164 [Marasmius tenuissimus]|uniref:Uncharacterized protein n=1 Tax=Marasmius tenuissimus TaxID=585030 RepID=A0ABR2ZQD3_9AGAR